MLPKEDLEGFFWSLLFILDSAEEWHLWMGRPAEGACQEVLESSPTAALGAIYAEAWQNTVS